MEYQLAYAGRVHALRADFDKQFGALSPGTYLNVKLLERLCGHSLTRYLMGPGNNPYKKRWSETVEPLQQIRIFSPSLRGRVLGAVDVKRQIWSSSNNGGASTE